jgi:hypothetical protein
MTLGDLKAAAVDREFFLSLVLRFVALPLWEIEEAVEDLKDRQLASLHLILDNMEQPQDGRTTFAGVLQSVVVEQMARRFISRQFVEADLVEGGGDE